MTNKTISIKINLTVKKGEKTRTVVHEALAALARNVDCLETWQEVRAPLTKKLLGECHFEINDPDTDAPYTA